MKRSRSALLDQLQGVLLIAAISLVVYLLWRTPIGRAFLIWFNRLGE